MSENHSNIIKPVLSGKVLLGFALCWFILFVVGLISTYRFAAYEQAHDEHQWERQITLVADAQRRQIDGWLVRQQAVVDGLANNVSLQLYLTELAEGDRDNTDQAFATFLSNLLASEAQQHGFYERMPTDDVPANIDRVKGSGLAIVDKQGVPIISTQGVPTLAQLPRSVQRSFKARGSSPIGPFLLNDSTPYLLVYHPISPVGSDKPQGYMMGVKAMDEAFAELFAPPLSGAQSSESLLVAPYGKRVKYLTQLADGTKPLALTLDMETPDLASAYGIGNPGEFMAKRDYRGRRVLAMAQPIANTNWTLLHKVDAQEALGEAVKRKQSLVIGYLLATSLLTIVLVAIWRNISAARAKQAAVHYHELSVAAEKQKTLLSHLIDTLIMLVDSRDPNAQHHSNNVEIVAGAIAQHMHLSADMQETTMLAASLMNVGKINAPQDLLTGKDISSEDKDAIRKAMLESADILDDIEFDGPVVETLRQSLEHVDGSGPLGLEGEDILISARIIAVANAFVAMISPRSYREAMSMEKALTLLHESVDTIYARPVVAALEYYLENDGGREDLAENVS